MTGTNNGKSLVINQRIRFSNGSEIAIYVRPRDFFNMERKCIS